MGRSFVRPQTQGCSLMNGRNVQPSIWYYGLAVLVIIIGFVAFAGLSSPVVSGIGSGLVQMTAPGIADLDLKEPGEYTLFRESELSSTAASTVQPSRYQRLQIVVSEKASGQTLATYPSSAAPLIPWAVAPGGCRGLQSEEQASIGLMRQRPIPRNSVPRLSWQ